MNFAFINNQIVPEDDVSIGLEDRGYQFGDGIYEVIGVYNATPFKMKEHLKRLLDSARKIKLEIGYTLDELTRIALNIKEKNNLENGLIYIQVSRGVAPRQHSFPLDSTPLFIAYTVAAKRPVPQTYKEGISIILTEDIRWLRCDIKTLNLLPNVLAKQEAVESNAYEAIFYRDHKTITEGSSTNLFVVKDNVVYTHPPNNLILNGITRQTVIELCGKLGIEVEELPVSKDFLFNADEVFICGTYIDILPVKNILNRNIEYSDDRNITLKLMRELEKMITFA